MVYRGHVKDGVVVVDDPVVLPEGLHVRIEIPTEEPNPVTAGEASQTLGQMLLKYAGKAVGLPSDAARNHDHYLYGTPKE